MGGEATSYPRVGTRSRLTSRMLASSRATAPTSRMRRAALGDVHGTTAARIAPSGPAFAGHGGASVTYGTGAGTEASRRTTTLSQAHGIGPIHATSPEATAPTPIRHSVCTP